MGADMKIEKYYYTKSKEELEEIRAELQAEREAMTEEEWLAEQLENERGFQKMCIRDRFSGICCRQFSRFSRMSGTLLFRSMKGFLLIDISQFYNSLPDGFITNLQMKRIHDLMDCNIWLCLD